MTLLYYLKFYPKHNLLCITKFKLNIHILGLNFEIIRSENQILRMVSDKDMPELLCRVNFPLYNVNMVSPRHVMLGGGGGAANTGVRNGFVSICLICYKNKRTVTEKISPFQQSPTDFM